MRKALLVGIDDYPNSPLHCCCNDVDALNSLLEKHGNNSVNFETRLVKNVYEKSTLLSRLQKFFAEVTNSKIKSPTIFSFL